MQLLIECTTDQQDSLIHDFCQFVYQQLEITNPPALSFVEHTGSTSFGSYQPSAEAIIVATEGRHISDILRTLGHELVHHKQLSEGENMMTLEQLEYEANAVAGMLMRDYNKLHPEMFGLTAPVSEPPDRIADSQGSTFPDITRPSGPINMAEAKAGHVGTCVNSFDNDTGECTISHHLPYRDVSHFASGEENAHEVSKEHFLKHATVSKELQPLLHKKSTKFLHDKENGVHMMYDPHKDVHHFFTEGVLTELSNQTLASYKRKANAEVRWHEKTKPLFRIKWKRGLAGTKGGRQAERHYVTPDDITKRKHWIKTAETTLRKRYNPVQEEMGVGGGAVAGIGIGPQGEPGVQPRKKKSPILQPLLRRKTFKQMREEVTPEEARKKLLQKTQTRSTEAEDARKALLKRIETKR